MEKTKSKKSLMPGMKPMALDGKEIPGIIESCAKNGVELLRFGGLELKLRPMTLKITPEGTLLVPEPTNSEHLSPSPEIIVQEQQKEEVKAIEQDELALREEQIAELLITDPLRAEEMMEEGLLEKDVDERGDELADGDAVGET